MITLNTTHQQTKSIVDPGNGTYQTVLTIDPSVGQSDIVGTYNCTVANARGESSETVVVPGETRTLLFSIHAAVIYRGTYSLSAVKAWVGEIPRAPYVSKETIAHGTMSCDCG